MEWNARLDDRYHLVDTSFNLLELKRIITILIADPRSPAIIIGRLAGRRARTEVIVILLGALMENRETLLRISCVSKLHSG